MLSLPSREPVGLRAAFGAAAAVALVSCLGCAEAEPGPPPRRPAQARQGPAPANPPLHSTTDNDVLMRDAISTFNRLADIYSTITDAPTARAAAPDIYPSSRRRVELQGRLSALKQKISAEEDDRLQQRYGRQVTEAAMRLTREVERVDAIPGAHAALLAERQRLGVAGHGAELSASSAEDRGSGGREPAVGNDASASVTVPQPAERASPDVPERINLLRRIDPARAQIQGEWRFERGVLVSPLSNPARLQIPYPPPERYQLMAVAERGAGSEAFSMVLVVGGHQVLAMIDGYGGNTSG